MANGGLGGNQIGAGLEPFGAGRFSLSGLQSGFLTPPSLFLDFVNGVGQQAGKGPATLASLITVTRASGGTNLLPTSASGFVYTTYGNNVMRLLPGAGLIVEESRINNLLNSAAPVTQTTASLGTGTYTLWVNGSGSATPSGGTATITGAAAATNANPNVFTVTVAGTVVVTVSGALNAFQLELGAWGTSLIITAGATVTRAADVVQVTSNLTFGSSFTMFLAGAPQSPITNTTNQQALNISDGTITNRANILRAATTGVGNTAFTGTSGTTLALAFNGVVSAAPTLNQGVNFKSAQSLTGASGMTTVNIGDRPDGALQWDGTISRVAVWPTQALSGAILKAITT